MDYWDSNIRGVFLCHLHASLSSSLHLCSHSPLICCHSVSMTLEEMCHKLTFCGQRGSLAGGKPKCYSVELYFSS